LHLNGDGGEATKMSDDDHHDVVASLRSLSTPLRHLALTKMTKDPNNPIISAHVYHLASLTSLSLHDLGDRKTMQACIAHLPTTLCHLNLAMLYLPFLASLTRLTNLKWLLFGDRIPEIIPPPSMDDDPSKEHSLLACAISSPDINRIWPSLSDSRIHFGTWDNVSGVVTIRRVLTSTRASKLLLASHQLHLLLSPRKLEVIKQLIQYNLKPPYGQQAATVVVPSCGDKTAQNQRVSLWLAADVTVLSEAIDS
jgi:hypothetical protein